MGKHTRNAVEIAKVRYIYRCIHIVMEGDCAVDHGPRGVDIGPFSADIFPVSNNEYAEFVSDARYAPRESANFLRHWKNGKVPAGMGDHPAVWVSLDDARAYASWAGGRLPTDEEWQFIAAGSDGRAWPWGADFDADKCNHDGRKLHDVTANPEGASWCGCQDLCGNAWEWTEGELDDGMHQFALIRGGCYYHAPDRWHVAGGARGCEFHWKMQLMNDAVNRAGTVGFRCVYEASS